MLLPFRDAGSALAAAVASILWQRAEDFVLLLIDDGSLDGAVKRLEPRDDRRVVVLADGARRGLPARLNQGVDWAAERGIPLIARMDADDVAHPDRLERQLALLEADATLDLVGTGSIVTQHRRRIVGCRRPPPQHPEICRTPYRRFPLAHPTWLGRTSWFRRHRYDEHALRSQDYQLLRSAWRASRFANVPDLLLAYDEGERNLGKALRSRVACATHLWRLGVPRGELRSAVAGSAGLIAGALADVAVGITGRPDLAGLRLERVLPEERRAWSALLATLPEERLGERSPTPGLATVP
ncbi:MAG TPA: glycosyltransferase [Phycisphaerales bacterium]|mgnify:CR=1 FL=1|nr:glycosyltransferase [Phycisphaerales bacterium]HMP38151.1 glycosyltransferase [Phycisphaerales bacterium]